MAEQREKPSTAMAAVFMFAETVQLGIRAGMWMFIAGCGAAVLIAWAGKDTNALINILVSVPTALGGGGNGGEARPSLIGVLIDILPWVLSAGAAAWAARERNLHRRDIERMAARTRELELLVDEQRETSGLLPDGTSPPKGLLTDRTREGK